MIDSLDFHELEQLIQEGRYSDARHMARSILDQLNQQKPCDNSNADLTNALAELLTDTLNMLLLYHHESQITTHPVKAARLLLHYQPIR